MIYLTYNDQPSGVYSSQVCDVCNFLNKELKSDIKLVAFISLHSFSENRKKIRSEFNHAMVLPALPKAKYWKFSMFVFAVICLFKGEKNVIARNIIAGKIALFSKKLGIVRKLVLDGRGAIAAEWNEYQVVPDENMKNAIHEQEKTVVLNSDFRIAVSSKLIGHWQSVYGYRGNNYVVIPCTLNSGFRATLFSEQELISERTKLGFAPDDVVMVYSGSTAGWQSFSVLGDILGNVLQSGNQYKLLFLAKEDESIAKMKSRFSNQVSNQWVKHNDVQRVLAACDYGILFRENSVTNQVASPTKFAEYLSAGLPVIISENLGDYSEFVKVKKCGMVIQPGEQIKLMKQPIAEKQRMVQLAMDHFTKTACKQQYETLLKFISKN